MARPRIIRLPEDREIHVKGATPEEAAKIKEALLGAPAPKTTSSEADAQEEAVAAKVDAASLSHHSFGIYKNEVTQDYMVVVIKFDPVTQVATVTNIENVGRLKSEAISRYKVLTARLVF